MSTKITKLIERKKIHNAAQLLFNSKSAIALTGAGVSTESGIPDFRGEGGIWEKYKPEIYGNINAFTKDPSKFWQMAQKMAPNLFSAKPNPGHIALAGLEDMDIKDAFDLRFLTCGDHLAKIKMRSRKLTDFRSIA